MKPFLASVVHVVGDVMQESQWINGRWCCFVKAFAHRPLLDSVEIRMRSLVLAISNVGSSQGNSSGVYSARISSRNRDPLFAWPLWSKCLRRPGDFA